MLGLLNAVISKGSGLIQYVKEGLVMANRFLTPPSLSHPAQGSAEFDGASDYIELDPAPVGADNAITMAGWLYTKQSFSAFKGIISKGTPNGYEDFIIFGGNTDKLGFYLATELGVSANIYSTTAINGGDWTHFACQWDSVSNTMRLYINGSVEATYSRSGSTIKNTDTRMAIGAYSDAGDFFNGNLANVAIWNRALSSDEINSVMWKGYSQLNTSELNGLQAWYSLTESESLVGDDTATLEKYAQAKGLTFEGKTCLQNALNAFPDITDARLYSANYDIRVSADGGSIEALSCVETELNALLV